MHPCPTEMHDQTGMSPLEQQEALAYRKMQLKAAGLPERTAWNIAYCTHMQDIGRATEGHHRRLGNAIESLTEEQRVKTGLTLLPQKE